jgi:hypothetical protein
MTVRELQEQLRTMPADKEVWYWWDGKPRSPVAHVLLLEDTDPPQFEVDRMGDPSNVTVVLYDGGRYSGPGDRWQEREPSTSWWRSLLNLILSLFGL